MTENFPKTEQHINPQIQECQQILGVNKKIHYPKKRNGGEGERCLKRSYRQYNFLQNTSTILEVHCQYCTWCSCPSNQMYIYCVLYNFWFLHPIYLVQLFFPSNQSYPENQCTKPTLLLLCITVLKDLLLCTICIRIMYIAI